ncbi:MAG TPA: hypothetical protein VG675_01270 [Bryobacteraceae bacterium]|nr:hypothetical protein [Bryobacteraceae bacterium]
MKWCLILLLACSGFAGDGPRLFYSKSFPGSVPPYVEITVNEAGAVAYREAPNEDNPITYQLKPEQVKQVFDLVAKLNYFKQPLESPLKVAFMGTKTFRYENGTQKSEVKFNYSEDLNAHALADWFERMAESAQQRINLERAAKYDKLGVVQALLELEVSFDHGRLLGLEQYLPMLDRISKNETYMHTARERAAEIAEAIRAGHS